MTDWTLWSNWLPQLVYPFNLALLLLLMAVFLLFFGRFRGGLAAVVIAFALLFLSASPLTLMLYRQHEGQFAAVPTRSSPVADTIVVLGGDVGIPVAPRTESQLNGNRLLHAYRLYKAEKAPRILITGGNVFPKDGVLAEATYSKSILVNWGIPPEVIMTETKSRNTHQNRLYSQKILARLGVDRILLVTDALHMTRAVAVFRRAGFEVFPSPSSFSATDNLQPGLIDWWPKLDNLRKAQALMHEKLGIFVYWLRGWID